MGSLTRAISELHNRRILTFDIERLPGLARVWDQKTRYIPVTNWTRLPSLLCVAGNWYGSKPVMFTSAWDDGVAGMVKTVWSWLDEADIVVGFNSDRFDLPHLKGAFLEAGLPPPRSYKSVDLFKVARKNFGFESKSLAHLCQRLALPGKHGHYDAVQAEQALAGDLKAQAALKRYNQQDVRATRDVYDALRPWLSSHPHLVLDSERLHCHACGSDKLERAGTYLAVVMEYAQYRCLHCHALVRAGHVRRVSRGRGIAP